jgi:hypothetical protein
LSTHFILLCALVDIGDLMLTMGAYVRRTRRRASLSDPLQTL